MTTDPGLNAAYRLDGPEGCRRLYAAWADSYDADFAAGMDYRLPALVAGAFLAAGGAGPVLDAGAGTGLVGAALLGLGFSGAIDGADLSPAMLARAARLGVYRNLFEADLTQPIPTPAPGRAWSAQAPSPTATWAPTRLRIWPPLRPARSSRCRSTRASGRRAHFPPRWPPWACRGWTWPRRRSTARLPPPATRPMPPTGRS